MSTAHQFESAEQALAFLLAGNARVTFVSQKTGTRFTFRVRRPEETSPWFVSLLNGSDNEGDYAFLGTIFPARSATAGHVGALTTVYRAPQLMAYRHGKKSRVGSSAPSARAFAWVAERLLRGELPAGCEVWHEGRCGRCGRALTVPESIASGIGPVCEEAEG
jgi:hypothetical protein